MTSFLPHKKFTWTDFGALGYILYTHIPPIATPLDTSHTSSTQSGCLKIFVKLQFCAMKWCDGQVRIWLLAVAALRCGKAVQMHCQFIAILPCTASCTACILE